eukprot:CAMPEP_0117582316 /NCGR_PEP_ID=MMETSP0784-20121206/66362_1 /TAXON_ID=39447 /ORGANISM="" /LENGTH=93 /DNA_ID=CAMNT_0005382819 /DNA_START=64 /DNA_END=345 /DNA_ORIENTATION=+
MTSGRTTTTAPALLGGVMEPGAADYILGVPTWAFAALLGIGFLFVTLVPMMWWFKRQANVLKKYVPSEAPDINGFVGEVVSKADVQDCRLGRA